MRGCSKCHLNILVSSSCCGLAHHLHSAQAGSYHLPEAVSAHGATGSREHGKTGEPEPAALTVRESKLHWVFLRGEQTKTTLISLSRMTHQDFVIFNSKLSSAVWCRGSYWRVKEWVISLRNTPVYSKPPAHPTASPSSNLGRSGLTFAHLKLLVS